jgi:hypothetical protein
MPAMHRMYELYIVNRARAVEMSFTRMKNERLVAFYENVRYQVEMDRINGGKYRFIGERIKQYADKLREEIDRRRLRITPIDWP